MLVLTFKIPRSKRWLLMKGNRYREEAKRSMQFVYDGDIEEEFEKMVESIEATRCLKNFPGTSARNPEHNNDDRTAYDSDSEQKQSYRAMKDDSNDVEIGAELGLCSPEYRPILFIGLGLLLSEQLTGRPSLLVYSRVLFESAGWHGNASVVMVICMALTSIVTVSLVDRLGRKILLLVCCLILSISLVALAVGFWGWEKGGDSDQLSHFQQHIVLWSMFVYIGGYQMGYGPITWCVLSEIYPSAIRGKAMALSVEVNFMAKFLIQLLFPTVQELLGWSGSFLMFACFGLVGLFFIGIFVPETKGMSLEEIQVQLQATYGTSIRRKTESVDSGKRERLLDSDWDFTQCATANGIFLRKKGFFT